MEVPKAEIRRILLDDWDPSEAKRSEAAHGTYDAYVDSLTTMIAAGTDESAIVDYLYEREREIMCFPGLGKQRLRRVAQKLLSIQRTDG